MAHGFRVRHDEPINTTKSLTTDKRDRESTYLKAQITSTRIRQIFPKISVDRYLAKIFIKMFFIEIYF